MLETQHNSSNTPLVEPYEITKEVFDGFLKLFKDTNPIHMDTKLAQKQGFCDRIMHGAILQGFVSHFVGTVYPGAGSVIHTVDFRYVKPCYLGDKVELHAWVEKQMGPVRVLRFEFFNQNQELVVARGRLQVQAP